MNQQEILQVMKTYFASKKPAEALEAFPEKTPRALMKDSMEVVDFIVELEALFDLQIDINQMGQTLIDKNFGELASMVEQRIHQAGSQP
jgi:acyl carrier protein